MDLFSKGIFQSKQLRLVFITVSLGYILLSIAVNIWVYFHTLQIQESNSLMRLIGIANSLSLQINGDAHQAILQAYPQKDAIQHSEQDSAYAAIHSSLKANFVANMLKTPVYTIVWDTTKNVYEFGITSADIPYFRHPYHSYPAILLQKNVESAGIPMYRDEFGTWLSAFATIKNSKGEKVALIMVDEKFDQFVTNSQAIIWKNLWYLLGGFLIFAVFFLKILETILHRELKDKAALHLSYEENRKISQKLEESLTKLKNLDDFRKEMIANVSHDLRTPLASVMGYLETVIQQAQYLDETQKQKYLNVAFQEAKRLNRLVRELFELSKLEAGQIQLDLQPLYMPELVQDLVQKYQIQTQARHIHLTTNFQSELRHTLADIGWIDRVLQNLLDNALKYTFDGGFITLSVLEIGNYTSVKVCNSGIPPAQHHLPFIFDRYFKSSSSRLNSKRDATGLGLAIVKKVIELHKGTVKAEVNNEITTLRFAIPTY